MTTAEWVALITALGVGAILREVVVAIIKGAGGKVGRERNAVEYERARSKQIQSDADDRVIRMQAEVDRIDKKLDDEIVKRRIAEGRAARYERLLILNGIIPSRDTWTNETTIEMGKEDEK